MSPRNADISIAISKDELTATIAAFTPADETGASLTTDMLSSVLQRAGVVVSPVQSTIDAALSPEADESIVGMVIAKAIPPKEAVNATIRPLGDLSCPVLPGTPFCEVIKARAASEGKTVTGASIKPAGEMYGKNIIFPEDAHCQLNPDTMEVSATAYGFPVLDKQTLFVRPLIEVDKGCMRVRATIHAKDCKGKTIDAVRLGTELKNMGILSQLDANALAKAVKLAASTGAAIPNVVIARGLDPINGKDGWFELYIKDERSDVGIMDEDGTVDFRSRGVIRSVTANAKLGRVHAPTRGIPGRDVFGKVIPAHDGAVHRMSIGENVMATEEGSEFVSLIEGMVFYAQNILSVTEVFATRGDVNMSTGNLMLEKGSVLVSGSVLSGFVVECPRNVLVSDTVESATIKAGGDVEVRGGIIMDRGGRIVTDGSISAMFAKGATIEAQGSVCIAHEMSNCIVYAGSDIVVTKGRGKIVGSTIRCGGSIIANEIGSDLGVATTIFLGLEQETTDFSQRKKELNALLQKVYASLGTGDPRSILQGTPAAKKQTVAQLLKMRLGAERELREIEEEIRKERDAMRQAITSRLKVNRVIHPGTVIHSYGLMYRVMTPLEYSTIYYSPEEERIVVGSL